MATVASSARCGSGTVLYHEVEHLFIKELCLHGPNVIRLHLAMRRCWWHIVGWYITPSDASTIEDVMKFIRYQPYWSELLLSGNIIANL